MSSDATLKVLRDGMAGDNLEIGCYAAPRTEICSLSERSA
jgi:hypothetical protein